jgi:hypothetical protein
MATEDIPTDRPAVKGAGFTITGPGRYRDAGGGIATVWGMTKHCTYPWLGIDSDGRHTAWSEAGFWHESDPDDEKNIVAGPLADESESAGLTGYGVFEAGMCTFIPPHAAAAKGAASDGHAVIDLSTIRKDQLVKPEPKREKRKGWVNVWDYPEGKTPLLQGMYDTQAMADEIASQWPHAKRIACIEVAFTVGEGLES